MKNKLTWAGLFLIIVVPVLTLWLFASRGPSINKIIETNDLLAYSDNQVELVFFGFVGCESVCPSALVRIGEALELAHSESNGTRVGALFADINYFREYELAERYSAGFSRNGFEIKGTHLNEIQVRTMSAAFGLRIVNDGNSLKDIQHTDHLFVLRKANQNWVLDTILPTGTHPVQIKDALLEAASRI